MAVITVFGDWLKEKRLQASLKGAELARMAGIDGGNLRAIEAGRRGPSEAEQKALADVAALGVTFEEVRAKAALYQAMKKGKLSTTESLLAAIPGVVLGTHLSAPTVRRPDLPPLAALIQQERAGKPPIDLAAVSSLDPKMLKDIERGKIPPDHLLRPLARLLDIPFEKMKVAATGKKLDPQRPANDYLAGLAAFVGPQVEMPYFGQVGCGEFLELSGPSIGWRPVPLAFLEVAAGDVADMGLLEAWGPSMNRATPVPILPGMQMLVRKQGHARPGQVVIATEPSRGSTCKRLAQRADGFYLEAESTEDYAPIKVEGDVRIDGVVLHVWLNGAFPS